MDLLHRVRGRNRLLIKAFAAVLVVVAIKLLVHVAGWEILSLNPLFSGIVAANVFLMGFLLSGVLSDFKESERLPGELAASLETLAEEVRAISLTRPEAEVRSCLDTLHALSGDLLRWFHREHRTQPLLDDLNGLTEHFVALEKHTQANFIARLRQEQSNLRRMLLRIHTIRETSFISSGYLVADTTTLLLAMGLILAKIDPFYESLFFAGVITFLLAFLLLLIRDLDNPFGYTDAGSSEDVSLKPLYDAQRRLGMLCPRSSDQRVVQRVN